jgi:hypothetical protein
MENSRINAINHNITKYVDRVFSEYTTHVTCPKDAKSYKEWFTDAFLPCCITRWYEPSCYDITNMYTSEEFFYGSISLFSDILHILTDYFDEYGKTMDMNKFNPENVMRCYACVYVIRNVNYFLDRYQDDDDDDLSNSRSETSDTSETSDVTSIDLFQSTETSNPDIQPDLIETPIESLESLDNTPQGIIVVNIIGDNDTDDEGDFDDTNSSLPELIATGVEDDDSTTISLPELDNDYELYETGVFVTENEFIEKNKNIDCVICWDVVMNYENSMKWNNCDHFTCITCHDTCMIKKIYKCPLCRM